MISIDLNGSGRELLMGMKCERCDGRIYVSSQDDTFIVRCGKCNKTFCVLKGIEEIGENE